MHSATHAGLRLHWQGRGAQRVPSEMLGHSIVTITLDINSHVLPNMCDVAMEEANYAVCGRFLLVGAVGLEPTRPCGLRILSPRSRVQIDPVLS